ncbi:MAG: hypothetical protein KC492_44525 [Myxococcales bacterium]|nr:hypothetical protein [Myxococcales bacterium]
MKKPTENLFGKATRPAQTTMKEQEQATCPECQGRGYAVFECDGEGHPPAELQSVDACGCLERHTFAPGIESDDLAAILFVHDLERGVPYAIDCALELMVGRLCRVSHFMRQPDALRELVSAARECVADHEVSVRLFNAVDLFDELEV